MKRILFSDTFWHTVNGAAVPQFEKGKDYPADNEDAKRCIARGIAEEVDMPDPVPEQPADAAAGAEAATVEASTDAPAADAPAADPKPAARAKK